MREGAAGTSASAWLERSLPQSRDKGLVGPNVLARLFPPHVVHDNLGLRLTIEAGVRLLDPHPRRQPTRPAVVIATASQSPLCVERLANVAAAEPLVLP